MLVRTALLVFFIGSFTALFIGCGDEDFKSGEYWLNNEKNWQVAAQHFRRSLEKNPDSWKVHKALINALGQGNDDLAMETQLRNTFAHFPDSARSRTLTSHGVKVLGEDRYNRIAANVEQYHLSNLLATQKGNKPDLLSRGIMAACRAKDTVTVLDYYERLLSSVGEGNVPDSVKQEMNFFIGPAHVTWIKHEWSIKKDPNDINQRLMQLDAGLILGDEKLIRKKLEDLASISPETINDPLMASKFGSIVGIDPFSSQDLTRGWDGSFSPDGKSFLFVRNMGNESNPDIYIYKSNAIGSIQTPLFKAVQHRLVSVTMPIYSPDEKWVYFFASDEKTWRPGETGRYYLYRIKPKYGSRPEKLTDAKILVANPHFDKDGSILFVKRDLGSLKSSVQIVRMDPKTSNISTVSRISEPVIGATFTPKGDSLIFSTDRGIFRRSVDGGAISVDLNWREMRSPTLSPDGQWLFLVGQANQLLALNRTNSQLYWLGKVDSPIVGISKDSKDLLVTRSVGGKHKVSKINLKGKIDVTKFVNALTK